MTKLSPINQNMATSPHQTTCRWWEESWG